MTIAKTLSLLGMLVLALWTNVASAHPIGLSRGDYRATPEGLEVSLAFSENELRVLGEDAKATNPASLANGVLRRVSVRAGDERCGGNVRATERVAPDGVKLDLVFVCPHPDAARKVDLAALFAELARGHRHEAVWSTGKEPATRLLFEGQTQLDLPVSQAAGIADRAGSPSLFITAAGFVHMGVEHILMGFDHLVFLLGLVVVGLDKRRVLGIVTAFTLAHSLTLALSVLGVWSPPGSVVEPLIALSVAYVGIENFFARSFERRTLVAFAFGLVHGFGFAGALGEVGFEGAATSVGLVAFNLGVELGQLAVLAMLLPLLAWMRRSPALVRRVVPAVNAAVVLLGVAWFVLRVA